MLRRNEASAGTTRAQRRKTIEEVRAAVVRVLDAPRALDTVRGVLFFALVEDPPGTLTAHPATVVYGKAGLAAMTQAAEDILTRIGMNMQQAEQAQAEARVRGRKGRLDA